MSGETERSVSGWTVDTLRIHTSALREAEEKFQAERDRRYTEARIADQRALQIKEVADARALDLAREIQTYKDEKANELRSQIERERGTYATHSDLTALGEKIEATLKPLISGEAQQRGRSGGLNSAWGYLVGGVGILSTIILLIVKLH